MYAMYGTDIWCRVMLEDNALTLRRSYQEKLFVDFCYQLEERYGHIHFFGGWTKHGWRSRQIHTFNTVEPKVVELHASVTGTILDDWLPLLYAQLHNQVNKSGIDDLTTGFLMIDYVEL